MSAVTLAEHVKDGGCFDPTCKFSEDHFRWDERWCDRGGRWAIGNPCEERR